MISKKLLLCMVLCSIVPIKSSVTDKLNQLPAIITHSPFSTIAYTAALGGAFVGSVYAGCVYFGLFSGNKKEIPFASGIFFTSTLCIEGILYATLPKKYSWISLAVAPSLLAILPLLHAEKKKLVQAFTFITFLNAIPQTIGIGAAYAVSKFFVPRTA